MATRSNIGYLSEETGEFRATYHHYDGYPKGLPADVKHWWDQSDTKPEDFVAIIEKGIANGGLRSFPEAFEDNVTHLSEGNIHNLGSNHKLFSQEFAYLFSKETGKLLYAWTTHFKCNGNPMPIWPPEAVPKEISPEARDYYNELHDTWGIDW